MLIGVSCCPNLFLECSRRFIITSRHLKVKRNAFILSFIKVIYRVVVINFWFFDFVSTLISLLIKVIDGAVVIAFSNFSIVVASNGSFSLNK